MAATFLDSRVLVLNKLWQVTDVCSVRRALCLVYLRHAEIVLKQGGSFYTFGFEEWRDFSQRSPQEDMVSTISFRVRLPRIIVLLLYDKVAPREVRFTRRNIFKRDGNICQYCGRKFRSEDLNLDHVVPVSRGGRDSWANVVCSCINCNIHKGNRLLADAGMHLIRKPRKPNWRTFVRSSFLQIEDESWQDFLDLAYWNVELKKNN